MGIISVKRPGGSNIRVYEFDRVLADLMKPKYNADLEQVIPAFKKCANSNETDINKLFKYARIFGVEEKLRNYLGVLL